MKILINTDGFSAVEALIVIVVIVILGLIGWKMYENNKPKTPATVNSVTVSSVPNSVTVIADVKSALASDFSLVTTTQGNIYPPDANTLYISSDDTTGPAQNVPGYSYLIVPKGVGLNFYPYSQDKTLPDSTVATKVSSAVTGELAKLNLTQTTVPSVEQSLGVEELYYQNKDTLCFLVKDFTQVEPSWVACSDKSAYAPAAAQIKPFANAYLNAYPSISASQQEFLLPFVKTSETSGYSYATMNLIDAVASFYEKDGTWYFYSAGQTGLSCNFTTNSSSSLNNNDARLAFLGQSCIDDNGQNSTVK